MQEALRYLQLKGVVELRSPDCYALCRNDRITGIVDVQEGNRPVLHSIYHRKPVELLCDQLRGADCGDTVEALVKQDAGGRFSAEVLRVIRFAERRLPGCIEVLQEKAWFIPEHSIYRDIIVPLSQLNGAEDGDAVMVEIERRSQRCMTLYGKVIEVLGRRGEPHREMMLFMKRHNFNYFFSREQELEADRIILISNDNRLPEFFRRMDYTGFFTFTIDPPGTVDIDDALSVRLLDNGNWELGVHIVDISYYVKPGSFLDREAYVRATSLYFSHATIPMFPLWLVSHCSFSPGCERRAFSILYEVDGGGRIVNHRIMKTLICSRVQYTYAQAEQVINEGNDEAAEYLRLVNRLTQQLRSERFRNGALSFEGNTRVRFRFDDRGQPVEAYADPVNPVSQLIEEVMLLANHTMAGKIHQNKRYLWKDKLPFIYRVHGLPFYDKFNEFLRMIQHLGYELGEVYSYRSLTVRLGALLRQAQGRPEARLLNVLALNTMSRAKYTTECKGHYALAYGAYTHFTAPLRRYADVVTHRLLEHYVLQRHTTPLEGYDHDSLQRICDHVTAQQYKAKEAQDSYVRLKSIEYMDRNSGKVFPAIVYGMNERGLVVELVDSGIQGRILLRKLPGDCFFDYSGYTVVNRRNNKKYRLGDPLYVTLDYTDRFAKQINFVIAVAPKTSR